MFGFDRASVNRKGFESPQPAGWKDTMVALDVTLL